MKKIKTPLALLAAFLLCIGGFNASAQTVNPKLKCYFNHPVNTNVSTGTNAIYLPNGFKDTLIAYINRAKYSIDVCIYNFYQTSSSDAINTIATAINAAYARGVTIRWVHNGTASTSNNALVNLNTNIHSIGSPSTTAYGICHNKFVVFDANSTNVNDPIVWTGSFNFTTEQNTVDYNNILIVQDQAVAQTYYNQFNQMWGGTTATPNTTNSKFGVYKTASTVNSFTVNGTPIQVYFSPKDGPKAQMANVISSANNEIDFGIYTWTDNSFATSIKTKISSGVSAFGILDSYSAVGTYTAPYGTLSPSTVMGTNLTVYNGGNSSVYHSKVMAVDALHPTSDPVVCTGSFNWTTSAEVLNDENFIIVHDAVIANQYYQALCKDFAVISGTSVCTSTLTGIENYDYGQQQYAVYPNPFKDNFTVNVKSNGDVLKIKVINTIGQLIKEAEATNTDQLNIDLQGVPAGIYYVQIIRADKIFVQKIVKE